MTTDPFEQLRVDDEPAAPDPASSPACAPASSPPSSAAGLPTVTLPERSTAMTDTATATVAAPTATGRRPLTPYLCVSPARRRPSTGTSTCSAPSRRSATRATTAASATPS